MPSLWRQAPLKPAATPGAVSGFHQPCGTRSVPSGCASSRWDNSSTCPYAVSTTHQAPSPMPSAAASAGLMKNRGSGSCARSSGIWCRFVLYDFRSRKPANAT